MSGGDELSAALRAAARLACCGAASLLAMSMGTKPSWPWAMRKASCVSGSSGARPFTPDRALATVRSAACRPHRAENTLMKGHRSTARSMRSSLCPIASNELSREASGTTGSGLGQSSYLTNMQRTYARGRCGCPGAEKWRKAGSRVCGSICAASLVVTRALAKRRQPSSMRGSGSASTRQSQLNVICERVWACRTAPWSSCECAPRLSFLATQCDQVLAGQTWHSTGLAQQHFHTACPAASTTQGSSMTTCLHAAARYVLPCNTIGTLGNAQRSIEAQLHIVHSPETIQNMDTSNITMGLVKAAVTFPSRMCQQMQDSCHAGTAANKTLCVVVAMVHRLWLVSTLLNILHHVGLLIVYQAYLGRLK